MSAAPARPFQPSSSVLTAEPASEPVQSLDLFTMWISWRSCFELAMTLLRAAVQQDEVYLRFVRSGNTYRSTVSTRGEGTFLETSISLQHP